MSKSEITKAQLIEQITALDEIVAVESSVKALGRLSREKLIELLASRTAEAEAIKARQAAAAAPKAAATEPADGEVKRPFLLTYKLQGMEALVAKHARFATAENAEAWATKHAAEGWTVTDIRAADVEA